MYRKLEEMIALDKQPISLVEDTSFVKQKVFTKTIICSILGDVKNGIEKSLS